MNSSTICILITIVGYLLAVLAIGFHFAKKNKRFSGVFSRFLSIDFHQVFHVDRQPGSHGPIGGNSR